MVIGITSFLLILPVSSVLKAHVDHPEKEQRIGIDERLGQVVALDTVFRDEMNRSVSLKHLIQQPTLLVFVYYSCPDVCSLLLYHLARTLQQLSAEPGKDYGIISISFDETENSELARTKKRLYLKMIERSFPEEAWKFLTGDQENIQRLAESAGFLFKREGRTFHHPVAVIVVSAEGKITRYLYGMDFLPFDLKMALFEASEGRVGPTISKVLRFCFSYDPKGRRYVFNTLKVTGIVTLTVALVFFLFLFLRGRRYRSVKRGFE